MARGRRTDSPSVFYGWFVVAAIFVVLAVALMEGGKPEEAIKVCVEGLNHQPDLLAGQVAER